MGVHDKATTLRDLHKGPSILVLPNAWDVTSEKIFERAGFPAIGTTSAGIAAALGCADGEHLSREDMFNAIRRIANSVEIPVTADLETGYGNSPEEIVDAARRLLDAGAAGLNLEDGNRSGPIPLAKTSQHVDKIRLIRETGRSRDVEIVINARTDVYLRGVCDSGNRFGHAVHRGNAYLAAGADCVFIPGVVDRDTIIDLVREIRGPINLLATEGIPSIPELSRLGVARESVGSGIYSVVHEMFQNAVHRSNRVSR